MKVYQPTGWAGKYDLYFKDKESCDLFSNYYFSFTGKVLITHGTNNNLTTAKAAGAREEQYPYTVSNYVEHDIVKTYLALFPEEEDV
jgi:hypothetical protein